MPTTQIDNLSIAYDHYPAASPDQARRLVYVHGTGCNARVFERHLQVLSEKHEAIAIDLPGHGGSEGDGFFSAIEHAFFVGRLIEHLGWDDCIVAGHSLGGGIAIAVAVYFERLVGGLVLIDTGARLRVSPRVIELARRGAESGRLTRDDSRLGYADTTPQSIVDQVNAINAGCDPKVIYKDWIADDSFDMMSRVHNITVLTLAICGEQDSLTPVKYHEFLRDRMPHCRLDVIAGAGHWPFMEQAETFDARVLSFLDGL